jgi:hypothetical protein
MNKAGLFMVDVIFSSWSPRNRPLSRPNERPQNLGVNFVGVPMIRFAYSLMATAEASCEVAG